MITKRTMESAVGPRKMNAMNLAVGKMLRVGPIGVAAQGFVAKFWEEVTHASTNRFRLSVNLG